MKTKHNVKLDERVLTSIIRFKVTKHYETAKDKAHELRMALSAIKYFKKMGADVIHNPELNEKNLKQMEQDLKELKELNQMVYN